MKISHWIQVALLFALLCRAAHDACAADGDDSDKLVDFKGTKIVVLHDTISPDGRYAIGWTLARTGKKAKPVDWSLWDPEDRNKFLDHYHVFDAVEAGDYEVDYFAVDLKSKTTIEIPVDFYAIHGWEYAAWSEDAGGKRYGLLQFDYKWGTGVWLVTIDAKGMRLTDVVKGMDKAVDEILPEVDSPNHAKDPFVTYYYITEDSQQKPVHVFHGAFADIPFESMVPKTEDSPGADGTVRLRLADAKVTRVSGDLPSGDLETLALRRNPELKKADEELNTVYRSLEKKLAPAAREALRKEQLAWIETRNAAVDQAADNAPLGTSDFGPIRDKAQLEATRKRTAGLKARLVAAH